ncbi:uncharacterized protein LOC117435702 [Acipenser ruthenus]|uniref:uncharacterized protein LOC117435702 n=1 Tax=Acipenser ruthenus TaxID=7906 RepID=UPI0015612513|nr:uncharacterized protein LOC117435702 [Acipenser ruthenus]
MTAFKALLLFLLCIIPLVRRVKTVSEICRGLHCYPMEPEEPRPCTGIHCPGRSSRPSRPFTPTSQGRSPQITPNHHNGHSVYPSRTSTDPNPIIHSQRGGHAENPKTRTIQNRGTGCTGDDCVSPTGQANNDTRDCKGIECKLPLRIRLKPRPIPHQCVGESCSSASAASAAADVHGQPALVRVSDRAAQFLGEFPDFGYPASELGGAPLGVQLTCDIKPGENEVPSEDALILQLQLAKGQEKFVEALKSQQKVLIDLQQQVTQQQSTLISQQKEILEQQRKMYEQMDLVKDQYSMLFETVKQMSFQSLQADIQSYFQSHLQGLQNQVRSHLHKSYAVHKVDVDAKVIDVGGHFSTNECGGCNSDEYCHFQGTPPQCEKCTLCPPGFFLVSECSLNADRICQDRDECIELPTICGERVKCLNTPGGFRCLGIAERDAASGVCGHGYFFNRELQECQACGECPGETVAVACSAARDTVCTVLSENKLSESWSAVVTVPPSKSSSSHIFPGVYLNVNGKGHSDLISNEDGKLQFKQHGLVWADCNFALKHSCRNFLQLSMKLNDSEEGWELSGVRIEQPDGKYFQSVSVSGTAEVEPNYTMSLFLKSPNQYCNQSKDLNVYDVNTPFSVFWLSHDTGAVAMSAQMSMSVQYQTNFRPTFKVISISDPYMINLSHDGRGVRFRESGVVKFVFQQALYSMGHTCIREGFSLVSYVNRNGTNQELMQVYKPGVNYRDTSISLSGAVKVSAGDMISFEIQSPSQCNIRYFGDNSGISMFSLIWIPSAVSTALSATVSRTGLPTGAVRNKAIHFHQVSSNENQIQLVTSGKFAQKYFVFRESGVASVAFNLKLIHSCNIVKLTLNQLLGDQMQPLPVTQQIGGHMPEGSQWTSVGLRSSFHVHNGTMIFITVDCVRGRINQIAHERGTNLSILWVSS